MSPLILVVDDNPTNLRLASSVLELEGYRVQQAVDAEDALRQLADLVPDLILMDISLPGMDGLCLTRLLKQDSRLRQVPVVALTAFAMKGDEEKAREAGCCDYITKPIDTREFPQRIAALLAARDDRLRILIADDHPANLRLLRAQLEAEGHRVFDAGNGIEALALLEHEEVDGIVSDILMPGMDGYRLCLEIRKHPRFGALPFILYTSTYNSPTDRALATEAGADAYLSKPAPTDVVVNAIRNARSTPRPPPQASIGGELGSPVLKQYSEALVRKLEEKSTELGMAYEGLAQTQARLSGMLESALDAIIALDEGQRVVLFNAAAERMFGCRREWALGQPVDTFIPQRFRDSHRLEVEAFGAEAEPARQHMAARTVWALRSDGAEFPIEASISALNTSQGRLSTVFVRDITERHTAAQALARSEAGLRHAQELARIAHVTLTADGRIDEWSGTLPQLLQVGHGDVPRSLDEWLQRVHPDDRLQLRRPLETAAADPDRATVEYRMRGEAGWIHVRQVMSPELLPDGSRRWFNTLQDVTEQRRAALRIESLNRILAVRSEINALIVRSSSREALVHEACQTAVTAGRFPKAWIALVEPSSGKVELAAVHGGDALFRRGVERRLEEENRPESATVRAITELHPVVIDDLQSDPRARRDGMDASSRSAIVLPLAVGSNVLGVLVLHAEVPGFFDDEQTRLLEELAADVALALDHRSKSDQIRYLANYDVLTDLPNRGLFCERLSVELQAADADACFAVLLLDIERFRRINETLGREAGDAVLKQVGQRLVGTCPDVARIGVDVFALVLRGLHSAREVTAAFDRLVGETLAEPFQVNGEELRIGCRGGIAVFPGDGGNAEALLRNAEAALRRARVSAERCVIYSTDLNARASESLNLESRLRRAITRGEFILHYQPKVRISDRSICGVEALLRWQDPARGLVAPSEFIPVLEECGLIGEVGDWALSQALADQRSWREAGLAAPRMSVNVSPIQLRRLDFAEAIIEVVGADRGGEIELEITESVIMETVERNIAVLKRVREAGIGIAIDDFGTGYCSLAYIARLPVDVLKIDRSFVVGMTDGPEGLAIVSSIIALAHALKLTVVAEGVETEEQARLLHLLSCDEAQGYLFSRPAGADAIATMLQGDRRLPVAGAVDTATQPPRS